MKYWAGVTDNGWFDFLSRANVDEVNFWQPRGKVTFAGLQPGSPFLFKLKRPFNHIAGGGYFVKSTSLPLSIAWDAFGLKNGAQSRQAFEAMIRRLVVDPAVRDPEIGCTVLSQPFFWPRDLWIPEPSGFASNIVRGRYYDTNVPNEAKLWHQVQDRLDQRAAVGHGHVISESEPELLARYGTPVLVKPRLGQGAFRVLVTDAYRRKCALTGESTLPVLEAAHILPFSEGGPHDTSNGLFLRSDFHKLFDLGMITVTPDYRVEVSPRIREDWFNGKAYYRLHGLPLTNLPESVSERPAPEFLSWHNDHCFQP
ncbi:MAG: restriction endonuclease [Rhodoferax ferrireducens]|uniref:Restriction endonuclease n=1 Tax=Rhodoferax ferrireducens TaxID=192843 RepID=A0A1W9KUX0_9BURK|nr:MAG: restriction endonuclease [Rhodoferax ferrireducens]